jgi:hypothetical protein
MEIEVLKNKILEIHEVWDVVGDSIDTLKYGGIHESYVIELISDYCIDKNYEVDGFPIKKRELSTINKIYDENYFCHERYVKYLDVLATQYNDVFELMYFYSSTFWPDQFYDEGLYKERLLDCVFCAVDEIKF